MGVFLNKIQQLKTIHDYVLVSEMDFGERITTSGVILPNDNGKSQGIRPRWGQVFAVGPDQKEVSPGDWICVAHGRWTRGVQIQTDSGVETVRRIDPEDILLVSDHKPNDETLSDKI